MSPDLSKALDWLKKHPNIFSGIQRGIERETLRVTENGELATTSHPENLGAALTNKWITTDFAETLLEFVTPVKQDIDQVLSFLQDIHHYVSANLKDEMMWPFSMPCILKNNQYIKLAQYGTSNIGKMKTIYREGLKNRYGDVMQMISGVHYNFSLPLAFWQARDGVVDPIQEKDKISAGYLRLIRNYYRFGWIIPYLFGASPAISSSFFKEKSLNLPFKCLNNNTIYMPYATSLRMSDLGYTNNAQANLGITFNELQEYVDILQRATQTPSEEFSAIGIKVGDQYRQLNGNILQIESEFYAPIRPKRVVKEGQSIADALLEGGIEYIEVRSLDVNPFSPIGIDADQVRFLDLFLIWCALLDAPKMSSQQLHCSLGNWNRIILEGRKPDQVIGIDCGQSYELVSKMGKQIFDELLTIAELLDSQVSSKQYQEVCAKLSRAFDDPELTFSARMLSEIKKSGLNELGLALAKQHKQTLNDTPYQEVSEIKFIQEAERSRRQQVDLEQNDTQNFESYLSSIGIAK